MQGGIGGVRQVVARGGRVTRAATRLRQADAEAGGSCWFCFLFWGLRFGRHRTTTRPHVCQLHSVSQYNVYNPLHTHFHTPQYGTL